MYTMKIKVPITVQEAKSTEIVASIDDLLIEILLRLPIKYLVRFKIVSKHWHSIITNPRCCRRQNPDPNPAVGIFLPPSYFLGCSGFGYLPFFRKGSTIKPFKLTKDPFDFRILHSCNGLLLCSGFVESKIKKYYVYNPTTNQSSTLPKIDDIIRGMSLAFDPAKSPNYKVVCVYSNLRLISGPKQYQLQIYSSEGTGAWRIIGKPFAPQVNFRDGVYWNDAVHWSSDQHQVASTLYFKTDHHHVLENMPNQPTHGRRRYYFGESCDHMHYVQIHCLQISFNVYEMKRDYSEWFVKYNVDVSAIASANPGMIVLNNYVLSTLAIIRGEEEENSFLVLQIPGKAIRYNLVSKTF